MDRRWNRTTCGVQEDVARWININNEDPSANKFKVRRDLEEVGKVESVKSGVLRELGGYYAVEMDTWTDNNPGKTPERPAINS